MARVGKVAYKLQLPARVQTHLVFHVSLLKKSVEFNEATSPNLPPIDEDIEVDVEP